MIKTYLVPVSEEVVKLMEKGEAPSFLHCATCLDGLANGEVMQKMFPQMEIISANAYSVYVEMKECNQFNNIVSFDVDWWNRKWGE